MLSKPYFIVAFLLKMSFAGEKSKAVRIIILFTWSDIMSDQPRLWSDMT